jgi:DNA-directed RNA polymerase specialized sigma24 family protein
VYALNMSPDAALADPRFRRALTQMVRKRVPEHDAEDIVQSAFAEALAAPGAPHDADALRRFIWGIARHKVADFYRRARREHLDVPELEAPGAPHSEAALLRWATRELPPGKDAEQTLEWMIREGEGEKLEAIAESENLPAPRVRQRVSRLRRHLRERWAVELAALAAIGAMIALIAWEMTRRPDKPITHDVPPPAPSEEPPRAKDRTPPPILPGVSEVPSAAPLVPSAFPSSAPLVPSAFPSAFPSSAPLVPSAFPSAPESSVTPPMPSARSSAPRPSTTSGVPSVAPHQSKGGEPVQRRANRDLSSGGSTSLSSGGSTSILK